MGGKTPRPILIRFVLIHLVLFHRQHLTRFCQTDSPLPDPFLIIPNKSCWWAPMTDIIDKWHADCNSNKSTESQIEIEEAKRSKDLWARRRASYNRRLGEAAPGLLLTPKAIGEIWAAADKRTSRHRRKDSWEAISPRASALPPHRHGDERSSPAIQRCKGPPARCRRP
jgi:hypothetical protein